MSAFLNLRYYATRKGETAPASYWGRPALFPQKYFFIGTWGCSQKRPFVDENNQICRIVYGKKVVLQNLTKEYQNWLSQ